MKIVRQTKNIRMHGGKSVSKVLAVFLAAGLCVGSLTACGNDSEELSEKGNNTRVIFTMGFDEDEVFRIEDVSCSRSEAMIYLTNTQNQYENVYGSEIWDVSLEDITLEDNVKDTVLAKLAQIKTMYLLAEEKEIVLEEQEESAVLAAAKEYFESLNETEQELLGIDLETLEQMYREYALADKVYQHIIQDVNPEISDDEARTITVQHILIRTSRIDSSGNRIPYSDSVKQTAYEKACEIQEMATVGEEDFAELASKYSEDTNLTYSFGKGEMEQAYENAAFSLETDEVSAVVESEIGYHIIKCINTFNREETDANKLEIVEQRKKDVFGQEYDKFVATLVRNLNQELWDEITFLHNSEVTTADFYEIYGKYFPS